LAIRNIYNFKRHKDFSSGRPASAVLNVPR
jgi:hypothetical protein